MQLTLTRAPGTVEAKQPHNIKDPPPYFTVGMRFFSAHASFFRRQTHRWCAWPKSSIFVSSDHSTRFQSKCQCRLANSRRLRLLVALNKGFFLATLPNSLLAWRWRLIVDLETWWPQDATKFCNSPTVALGFPFASRTICLTVRGGKIHLRPLPGKFTTSLPLLP